MVSGLLSSLTDLSVSLGFGASGGKNQDKKYLWSSVTRITAGQVSVGMSLPGRDEHGKQEQFQKSPILIFLRENDTRIINYSRICRRKSHSKLARQVPSIFKPKTLRLSSEAQKRSENSWALFCTEVLIQLVFDKVVKKKNDVFFLDFNEFFGQLFWWKSQKLWKKNSSSLEHPSLGELFCISSSVCK